MGPYASSDGNKYGQTTANCLSVHVELELLQAMTEAANLRRSTDNNLSAMDAVEPSEHPGHCAPTIEVRAKQTYHRKKAKLSLDRATSEQLDDSFTPQGTVEQRSKKDKDIFSFSRKVRSLKSASYVVVLIAFVVSTCSVAEKWKSGKGVDYQAAFNPVLAVLATALGTHLAALYTEKTRIVMHGRSGSCLV